MLIPFSEHVEDERGARVLDRLEGPGGEEEDAKPGQAEGEQRQHRGGEVGSGGRLVAVLEQQGDRWAGEDEVADRRRKDERQHLAGRSRRSVRRAIATAASSPDGRGPGRRR